MKKFFSAIIFIVVALIVLIFLVPDFIRAIEQFSRALTKTPAPVVQNDYSRRIAWEAAEQVAWQYAKDRQLRLVSTSRGLYMANTQSPYDPVVTAVFSGGKDWWTGSVKQTVMVCFPPKGQSPGYCEEE